MMKILEEAAGLRRAAAIARSDAESLQEESAMQESKACELESRARRLEAEASERSILGPDELRRIVA